MKKSFSMLALASVLLAAASGVVSSAAAQQVTPNPVPRSGLTVYTGGLTDDCTVTLGGVTQGKNIVMTATAREKVLGIQADRGSEFLLTLTCDGASGVYKGNATRDTFFSFRGSGSSAREWHGFFGPVPPLSVGH